MSNEIQALVERLLMDAFAPVAAYIKELEAECERLRKAERERDALAEALREAVAGCTDVSSGPDGRGTMRVVISGFAPGKEHKLHDILNDARLSGDAAAGDVGDRG